MTAYHLNREYSMESRLSWERAQHAAREYDVTVICARTDPASPFKIGDPSVRQAVLRLNRVERTLMSSGLTYYLGYRLWHRRVFQLAERLHRRRRFDLVHHVSFCGYRVPGGGSRLGVPFIWGPVGGTHPFPVRFLGQLDPAAAVREVGRNILNWCQLRFDPRVRQVMNEAAAVLAANREVAADLADAFGRAATVQLETGISGTTPITRPSRDPSEPIRILWSGRLRAWKALPLLLRALAKLPANCQYELRVLGQGQCLPRWQRLAVRLGIDQHIHWVGWPAYAGQLPHYRWADVFAFTSLRDTSGTGLLEALAAGAPIVGLDHQGAADVMTDRCAVRVPATTPKQVVTDFRDAIMRLASDADLHATLAAGAVERAQEYDWERHGQVMSGVYESVWRKTSPMPSGAEAIGRPVDEHVPVLCAPHEVFC